MDVGARVFYCGGAYCAWGTVEVVEGECGVVRYDDGYRGWQHLPMLHPASEAATYGTYDPVVRQAEWEAARA